MSTKWKIFWWIEDSRSWAWFSPFSALILLVLFSDLVWLRAYPIGHMSVEMLYVACVGFALLAFQKMSCELSELAWVEPLRLLPGFARALRLGGLRCVALLSIVGALSSLITHHWLPWIGISYAAAVLAALHLPTWITPRREANLNSASLKEMGQQGMSWATVASLAFPMLALHDLPPITVFIGMALLIPAWLSLMWRRVPGASGLSPKVPAGSLLRTPNALVVATVLLLFLSAHLFQWNVWKGQFYFGWMVVILPFMGLSAMGRQGPDLRSLLGRLWLLGMSRSQICRNGMLKLWLALASEYAIYFLVILVETLIGKIEWHILVHLVAVLLLYAILSWSQAVTELVQGVTPLKGQITRNPLAIVLCIPGLIMLFSGNFLSWYGLLAVLCALAAIPWLVRDCVRSFETVDLW